MSLSSDGTVMTMPVQPANANSNGGGFGWGDNGALWLIVLFLFIFAGGWGNGNGWETMLATALGWLTVTFLRRILPTLREKSTT